MFKKIIGVVLVLGLGALIVWLALKICSLSSFTIKTRDHSGGGRGALLQGLPHARHNR
jgi:hypothetical protein